MEGKEIIDIVRKYKPEAVKDWGKFDKSKENDVSYCIEWGIKKAQNHEYIIFEKMMKELERSLTTPPTKQTFQKAAEEEALRIYPIKKPIRKSEWAAENLRLMSDADFHAKDRDNLLSMANWAFEQLNK